MKRTGLTNKQRIVTKIQYRNLSSGIRGLRTFGANAMNFNRLAVRDKTRLLDFGRKRSHHLRRRAFLDFVALLADQQ